MNGLNMIHTPKKPPWFQLSPHRQLLCRKLPPQQPISSLPPHRHRSPSTPPSPVSPLHPRQATRRTTSLSPRLLERSSLCRIFLHRRSHRSWPRLLNSRRLRLPTTSHRQNLLGLKRPRLLSPRRQLLRQLVIGEMSLLATQGMTENQETTRI